MSPLSRDVPPFSERQRLALSAAFLIFHETMTIVARDSDSRVLTGKMWLELFESFIRARSVMANDYTAMCMAFTLIGEDPADYGLSRVT